MRILITGITGFAGSHLADALADGGHELHGTSRSDRWPPYLTHFGQRVISHIVDLCNSADLEQVLREANPDQIYHLAGYAASGRSFHEPDAAWTGNLAVTGGLDDKNDA